MIMQKKRGPKPLGGTRVIIRLFQAELAALDAQQQKSKKTRTTLIREAIARAYMGKRRDSDWSTPPKQ
jgi:hypothetical protein